MFRQLSQGRTPQEQARGSCSPIPRLPGEEFPHPWQSNFFSPCEPSPGARRTERGLRENITAAFASAALAFFNLALQASRSRRRFCRILRSFWKGRKTGKSRLLWSCWGWKGTRYHLGINLFPSQKYEGESCCAHLLSSVSGLAARDPGSLWGVVPTKLQEPGK